MSASGAGAPQSAANGWEDCSYLVATRGYAVVPDYLSPETCERLKKVYVPILEAYRSFGTERSVADRNHIHDLVARDVTFARLLEDERLQHALAPLLGPCWIMYAFTTSSVPPHGANYGSRIHVDSPRNIPGYPTNIGVIWALDDFTEQNGGTELLPGSHHSSVTPSKELFDANCERLTCKAGSLIVFHARVFHRAGVNHTDRWRHALTMNACRPFMKQRMDWVRLMPDSISRELNEQARRIVGFDTRLPTSLEEFFVPDGERLYKPNQE
jgi:ectoine hydroxylase-related dioxygenase (phytanoyl-CoA dioxygenase family)